MQFIDEAEIFVKAGDGGAGAVAFRRRSSSRAAVFGRRRGDGGDIVLGDRRETDDAARLPLQAGVPAKSGEPGRGRDQNGHAAPELVLKVPPGTLVRDVLTAEVLADLREKGRRWVLAKGGRAAWET